MSLFGVFKSENPARSKLFTFWDEYGAMVTSLLQFLKAERTRNCYLIILPWTGRTARFLPVYLADMQQLELTHPDMYNDFAAGNHSISRSGQPFSQVSADMAPGAVSQCRL